MPRLLVSALALALLAAVTGCGGGGGTGGGGTGAAETQERDCAELDDDEARKCYTQEFTARVDKAEDPVAKVEEITAESRAEGGFLLSNCHGIMHAVGRSYAGTHDVTLESLMEHLPGSNDPGCPAGFAHGVVTAVAPQLDLADPRGSASACEEAETRYQRYSCIHGFGHAFMRVHGDELEPALELCRAFGAEAPDCAQGAFHDYWFAVAGLDDAEPPAETETDQARLCSEQPDEFVRPCWYRAFVDRRPEGVVIESWSEIDSLCAGLSGLQREACITAASVIGPADPRVQIPLCRGFQGREAVACIRGVKAQNLLGQPPEILLDTIQRCDLFAVSATRNACYRWLGKTLSVLTDGAFAREGCRKLGGAMARRACTAGARSVDEPLVTFS